MRIFRIEIVDESGESLGYTYRASRQAMREVMIEVSEKNLKAFPTLIDIRVSKKGVLRALEQYASHPDNG